MWKNTGLAAAFLLLLAAPAALHAMNAPQRRADAPVPIARAAVDRSFVPTCRAGEVVDTRPDPAWIDASFSNDNCWAPKTPPVVDGYTARREQIVADMAAVRNYAALSDVYQRCISRFVATRRAQADRDKKPIDASLVMIENHRIAASENNKKKLAERMKFAINAFNEFGSECGDD